MSPEEINALLLSLRVAVVCVVISLPPALALSWLLARKHFRGKLLVEGVVHLPLVLPPVVTGYLLLLALGPRGPLGRLLDQTLGFSLAFSWRGAVVASAVVGFPLMVRAIRLSMERVDPRLEQAAATLGSGPWRTFARITLPLSLPGVVTGAVLSFARSLGEFGATIIFVGNIAGETRTLPLAVFTALQLPGGEPQAMRLVVLAVVLSLCALVGSEWSSRRLRQREGLS
jgi:molybdate transport system permease protein